MAKQVQDSRLVMQWALSNFEMCMFGDRQRLTQSISRIGMINLLLPVFSQL